HRLDRPARRIGAADPEHARARPRVRPRPRAWRGATDRGPGDAPQFFRLRRSQHVTGLPPLALIRLGADIRGQANGRRSMARVVGIGGVFMKVPDADAWRAWYA